jgi:hypothetical protein
LTIAVGAFELAQALQVFTFTASVGTYAVAPNGTTPPPAPTTPILVPSQFTKGSSNYDIAIIRLPAPMAFNLTSTEIKIANFPTSSPIPSENLFAVAYGNQNPLGPSFPQLKFAQVFLKKNNLCASNLTGNNVTVAFNASSNFCIQSKIAAQTNGTFNGVCGLDIGGAIVRDLDITNPNDYYEVVGLISYADDATTCNSVAPVPAIITYLSVYQNGFITPIAGSLAANNNGQNATLNPNSAKGNFVCGNGIVEASEKCEGTANRCCNPNTCAWRQAGFYCGAKPKPTTKPNKCVTRLICDSTGGCATHNKTGNRKCAGKNTKCVSGVCNKCTLGTCTPVSQTV